MVSLFSNKNTCTTIKVPHYTRNPLARGFGSNLFLNSLKKQFALTKTEFPLNGLINVLQPKILDCSLEIKINRIL